ncbi:GntR family transcriptional regulator [Acidiferrimicrobium sp. IK]|uniref:FadR/GntR family transcriptional regulator n=1 Tax=Acidiferrimicrobium sp. IK TaxID=2871700 RepID=UPI0021CB7067|nr:GntR family transcriptional regulator [Acidiferrimicrobium sp. IK]MCU4185302.1 GntR family transcriptional regulator [Acidiferrimicrobium sp. IK]
MAVNPDRFSVRVPKTAELVAGHIRSRIVRKDLREGDALPPENALMEDFSVSRPTLREAFRILESEGLITVRRGARGGARVQEPSIDVAARYAGLVLQHRAATLSDVVDARVVVEAPAAAVLASRRDRAASASALRSVLDSDETNRPAHFHEFNALVVELTGNQTLILLTAMIEHISRLATINYMRRTGPTGDDARMARRARRGRAKLIDLIAAGDAVGAEAHWRAYLTEAGKTLVQATGDSVLGLLS